MIRHILLALVLTAPVCGKAQVASPAAGATEQQPVGLLSPAATDKLLPSSVLYKGQQAPVQARNSGAIRYPDGALFIASMIDSSGYSTSIREKYQFFLYTERALSFSGKTLAPGFYGAGFLQDNTMVITDVSGRDLIATPTMADAGLKRPRPLQIVASSKAGEFRLYLGRAFVTLTPAN